MAGNNTRKINAPQQRAVDFEKAFDSVSWKYLDFILGHLGFEDTWRLWIHACLCSARTSILVNGSPTAEFSLKQGIRQGDPLSPFLFILVMEGLHIALNDANMSRLGIYYMSLFKVLELVLKALERLRAEFFWGSDSSSKKLAWINWNQVLASLERGGLGVESLKSFNLALLLKWRWRLVSNPNALWVSIIKAIQGGDVGLGTSGCFTNGVWAAIIGSINTLHSNEIPPKETLCIKLATEPKLSFGKTHGSVKNL
ncbi:RNA-directed DNA polymerase, eukaryota, reverse transcriptase zinc-binding domain protein [Tanacetum coccineum]